MDRHEFEEGIVIGPELNAEGLRTLAKDGFRSIIDLRRDDEEGLTITPWREEEIVQEEGLQYRHIETDLGAMDYAAVDSFRALLAELEQPVYIHSIDGRRAAVLAIIDRSVRLGKDPKEAVRHAEAMGGIRAGSKAEDLIAGYVSDRAGSTYP